MGTECPLRNEVAVRCLLEEAQNRFSQLMERMEVSGGTDAGFPIDESFHEVIGKVKRALDYTAYDVWLYAGKPTSVPENRVSFPLVRMKSEITGDELTKRLLASMDEKFPGLCIKNMQLFYLLVSIQPYDCNICRNSRFWLEYVLGDLRHISEHRYLQSMTPRSFEVPVIEMNECDTPGEDFSVSDAWMQEVLYGDKLPAAGYVFCEEGDDTASIRDYKLDGLECDPLLFSEIMVSESTELCALIYRLMHDPETELPPPPGEEFVTPPFIRVPPESPAGSSPESPPDTPPSRDAETGAPGG